MRLYLSSFRLGNKPEVMLDLLKGAERVGVIANAGDHRDAAGRREAVQYEFELMASLGLSPSELDLREYFGRPDALAERLLDFDLLWGRGGNTFTLRRAFRQSGLERLLPELLKRDVLVYAGYSAAVSVLSPTLRGDELVDDPNVAIAGYDPEIVWDGLGVIPYSVAPHYKSDHPESAAIDHAVEYLIDSHMPFVALRDGEAIVIDGERQFVVG